jgi:asparagine N-glycosylation enzyme membrane subunit Stt3
LLLAAAAAAQYRMVYYAAVPLSLAAGHAFMRIAEGLREARRTWAVALLAGVLLIPNFAPAMELLSRNGAPPGAWRDVLDWMRFYTPEPFPDPEAYHAYHERPAPGTSYRYPPGAYGVMNWWDYGYWISAIARRIPVSNPTQKHAREAALFYTAETPEEAVRRMRASGARYVLADAALPMRFLDAPRMSGGLGAMAVWAGRTPSRYFEVFYRQRDSRLEPVVYFYPEYFRTMAVRLAAFRGAKVQAEGPVTGIVWSPRQVGKGRPQYKRILSEQTFSNYAEGLPWLEQQRRAAALVSSDPLRSPIDLEPLMDFRLVYRSAGVQLFEMQTASAR